MRRSLDLSWPVRLGAALGFLVAVGLPQSAHSAERDYGWWYQGNVGVGVTPPPPQSAPKDGIYVAGNSLDAIAIGALRVNGNRSGGTLRLDIASTSGTVAVVVCPVTSPWRAAQAGAWAERPTYDCQRGSSRGTIAVDGAAVSFTVPGTLNVDVDDTYDLAVVPDPADPAVFELALKPPGPAAFTSASAGSTQRGTSGSATNDTSLAGAGSGGVPPEGGQPIGQVGGVATPGPSAYGLAELSPLDVAAAAAPLTTEPEPVTSLKGTSWAKRLLVVGLLFAVADGLWLLGYRKRHGPSGADGVVDMEGGIGRFVRPRQGPPARL